MSCTDKMKWGDRNTTFFHRKASWRAKKNSISSLRKSDGSLTENLEEIKGITNYVFKQLYSCDDMVDPSRIIPLVNPLVCDDMNEALCKLFS